MKLAPRHPSLLPAVHYQKLIRCITRDYSRKVRLTRMTASPMHRTYLHRLTPDRALTTIEAAIKFVREIGLVLRTPDPYLPSLFGAAQGKPFKSGAGGFGNWPAHAWWWDREISALPDVLTLKLIRGRTTFAASKAWPAIDAAVRGRISERLEEFELELIDELRQRGPTPSRELNITRRYGRTGTKRLKKARDTLESRALLLGRPITHGDHSHDTLLELWETRFPKPLGKARGIEPLLLMCLRTSGGPVTISEIFTWLTWPKDELCSEIQRLISRKIVHQTSDDQIESDSYPHALT